MDPPSADGGERGRSHERAQASPGRRERCWATHHEQSVAQEAGRSSAVPTEVEGKQVAVFNVGGQFHAMDGGCPHRGGPLGEGYLEDKVVTCPWHGWRFDVTTGVSPVNPAATVPCFPVKVEGTDLLVGV